MIFFYGKYYFLKSIGRRNKFVKIVLVSRVTIIGNWLSKANSKESSAYDA